MADEDFAVSPEFAFLSREVTPSRLERPVNRARRQQTRFIRFILRIGAADHMTYDMRLMPEQYSDDTPSRTTVVQTRGGWFIDHFGLGLGTVTFSGTTGWGQTLVLESMSENLTDQPTQTVDGYDRWVGLRKLFETFLVLKQADVNETVRLLFYNFLEKRFYEVFPLSLPKLSRSVREPLLFRYEVQLQVLDQAVNVKLRAPQLAPNDTVGTIGVVGIARADALVERMGEQLNNLAALTAQIQTNQDINQIEAFDPANPSAGLLGVLDQSAQDEYTQSFVDAVIRRQAPPQFVVPADSAKGVVGRTRTLAAKIRAFSQGTTDAIESSVGEVQAIANGWRAALDAVDYTLNLPVVYAREVRETLCAVQSLLIYPQLFRHTASGTLKNLADILQDSGCATTLR